MHKRLYQLSHGIMTVLACLFTVLVFLLNVLYQSEVSYTKYEVTTISGSLKFSLLTLAVWAVMIAAAAFLRGRLRVRDIGEKKLFYLLTVLYAIAALYLILNVDTTLRADAETTFNTAKAFRLGDRSMLQKGGYMYRYPHQLGLMLYDCILTCFSTNPAFNFVMNFAFVIGINYLSYKISDTLFHDKAVNLLTIVCAFAFLPQLFFILFAYGLTPGFFFLMLAFYAALVFTQRLRARDLVVLALSAAAAILLKRNYMIGVMALAIFFLLKLLERKNWRYLLAACVLTVCMVVPSQLLISGFEAVSGTQLNEGTPSVLWFAMGTDLDNTKRAPGWYDSSNYDIYTDCGSSRAASAAIGREKLAENFADMRQDPARLPLFPRQDHFPVVRAHVSVRLDRPAGSLRAVYAHKDPGVAVQRRHRRKHGRSFQQVPDPDAVGMRGRICAVLPQGALRLGDPVSVFHGRPAVSHGVGGQKPVHLSVCVLPDPVRHVCAAPRRHQNFRPDPPRCLCAAGS